MSGLTLTMKNQQGIALFVSLIFLLVLTILGISGMQSTVLEEKMAGNFKDMNTALQASETVTRVGEDWIQELSSKPDEISAPSSDQVWALMNASDDPSAGNVDCDKDTTMWWRQCDGDWWIANAVKDDTLLSQENGDTDPQVLTSPRYIIEQQSFIRDNLNVGLPGDGDGRDVYRVTGRGTGGSDLTRVLIQSSYARRF